MIPPAEALGKGHQNYRDTIPASLLKFACSCPRGAPELPWIKLPNTGTVGILVHKGCRKPSNLWNYIEECYNCEQLYVVKQYPDHNLICSDCG